MVDDCSLPEFLEVPTRIKRALAYHWPEGRRRGDEVNEQDSLRSFDAFKLEVILTRHFPGILVTEEEAELLETVGEAIELVRYKLRVKQLASEKHRQNGHYQRSWEAFWEQNGLYKHR